MSPWKRTYIVVFVSNLVTAVAMMSFLPFFPSFLEEELGVTDRDAVEWWAGLCFGAAPFAAAIMGPIWGSLSDRLGHKLMIVRALLAITVFVGAMSFVQSPLQLFLLRLMQGVFSGFIPPSITLVSISAPAERQGRVAGDLQAALAAGSVVGPILGAALGQLYGMRVVFTVVGLAALASALLVALFASEDASLRTSYERWSPSAVLRSVGGDFVRILGVPVLRRSLLILVAVQFAIGAGNPLLELYVRDLTSELDAEVLKQRAASLFTFMSIAMLVATPIWGRLSDRFGQWRVIVVCGFASACILGAHAVVPSFAALVVVRVLLGCSAAGSNAASFGLAATETPTAERGAAMAVTFSARALAVAIGAMCGGAVASWIGLPALFLSTGALALLASVALGRRPTSQASRSAT